MIGPMFAKVYVALSEARNYTLYVSGERVEIVGTMDGHSARFGSARWNGRRLCECTAPLRAELLTTFEAALYAREAPRARAS
jgi:hypothetical protein